MESLIFRPRPWKGKREELGAQSVDLINLSLKIELQASEQVGLGAYVAYKVFLATVP